MSDNSLAESELLHASRNGDAEIVRSLLERRKTDSQFVLNINCHGKNKANKDWTGLLLSSYFGHCDVVKLLLENGADVNVINDVGDSSLHRAAFTGRQDIVLMLLKFNADVNLINADGQTPSQVAKTPEIKKLIKGAEITEMRKNEERFLKASRDGDLDTLTCLLKSTPPLNINCVDIYGNSGLHRAAMRGRKEVIVLLLQNGIDTSARNARGQTSLDLVSDPRMRLLLDVKSIGELNRSNIHRHEGALFKKVRLLGWKEVWVVLEKGVLSIFSSRGDASTGANRKLYRYLDGAAVQPKKEVSHVLMITFSNHSVMSFSVGSGNTVNIIRQKWENAIKEHIRYSNNFGKVDGHVFRDDKEDESVLPLGSLQDALLTAQAHQQIVGNQVKQLSEQFQIFNENGTHSGTVSEQVSLLNYHQQMSQIVESSKEMIASLSHCLTVFMQQEQVRKAELEVEMEKSRILQESLHVLAQEHLALERSVGGYRSPSSFCNSEADEFYDCEDSSDEEVSSEEAVHMNENMTKVVEIFTENETNDRLALPSNRSSTPIDLGKSIWGGRSRLPVASFARTFSVWNFLKQCIGRELSKITMPVVLNEPLSFLQRTVEYLEYAHLLKIAADCDDPVQRLEFVTAFAVSASASNWERLGKPFNPLLGETYELSREDLGFRVVCEQVSHHPPVSAFHAESTDFIFNGAIQPKLKFWGKSVEVTPKGVVTLYLPRHDEVYSWTNINCCVHNIIVGKIWIEHSGTMEIICHKTRYSSVLTFKTCGWFGNDLHKVEGYLYDDKANKLRSFYGKWTEVLYSCDFKEWEKHEKDPGLKSKQDEVNQNDSQNDSIDDITPNSNSQISIDAYEKKASSNERYNLNLVNQKLLWTAIEKPSNSSQFYNFTLFAMILNEIDETLKQSLPPTDCRLRPDMRRMEEGDIDGAADEKNRLEEKQRESRKSRNGDDSWKATWFEQNPNPHTKREDWIFTGTYWNRDWLKCPDIF